MADAVRNKSPSMKVSIHISCKNLKNKDVSSKSDPVCALYGFDSVQNQWFEAGRTEVVKDNLDPNFMKSFEVDYFFELVQKIRFMVYDVDNASENLNDDDFLGSMECTLGEAIAGTPLTRPLLSKNKQAGKSSITVKVHEVTLTPEILTLKFHAKHLEKKDLFGKSDPYLVFNCSMPDGSWQPVHKTEVIKNNLDPEWEAFDIRTNQLATLNYDQPIKVDCYDYDKDGSHDLIGSFQTSINQLLQVSRGGMVEWECVNPKKISKKGYCNSGMVYLTMCNNQRAYSFLDYLFAGLQLNFSVAIDFTASNGSSKSPEGLHYTGNGCQNKYFKTIEAVGKVLQDYDSDQMYPALGFGAKIPPDNKVSHEFPLNFDINNPFCKGIQGILDAYKDCVEKVRFYGPTNFTPVIEHVARFALQAHEEKSARNYFVLLIITDGEITDMPETLESIVKNSPLPLSIIIVGVGEADFSKMDRLDSDQQLLSDEEGNKAVRDVVQFVPMREFEKIPIENLARHVLAEIPKQVFEYFTKNHIVPGTGVVRQPPAQQTQHQ